MVIGIPFEMLGVPAAVEVPLVTASGEVFSWTDPELRITENTLVYEDQQPAPTRLF